MAKLIECIPNFSEGKNTQVIDGLVAVAQSVSGVALLDHSSDTSHNRSVFTLLGDPKAISEVAFLLAKKAQETIDLTCHKGEHPRMGAVDVMPFVPIKNTTMAECVAVSQKVGKRIWEELSIPVFLYEESATTKERQNLANIRKGEFEGMAKKMKLEQWAPDFGECAPHKTAGVVAVGARMPLVAFNVNLSTSNVNIAKHIAKTIRASSGGLPYCKAIGVKLSPRNVAQVSMNLVNYEKMPIYRVFELIAIEAKRFGVHIVGSELIGLAPSKALADCAAYYLQLEQFNDQKQILENHIINCLTYN